MRGSGAAPKGEDDGDEDMGDSCHLRGDFGRTKRSDPRMITSPPTSGSPTRMSTAQPKPLKRAATRPIDPALERVQCPSHD